MSKKFKVTCIKEVIGSGNLDRGDVYFIKGKEYEVEDVGGTLGAISEVGGWHTISEEGNRGWFKEHFKK